MLRLEKVGVGGIRPILLIGVGYLHDRGFFTLTLRLGWRITTNAFRKISEPEPFRDFPGIDIENLLREGDVLF